MAQATPTLSTQITVITNGGAGQPVVTSDTATLTGAGNLQPGGTVTFWLVGPAAGTPSVCPSTANALIGPITAAVNPATGIATTGAQTFTPAVAGDYYWIAQYSGDANNAPTAQSAMSRPGRARRGRQDGTDHDDRGHGHAVGAGRRLPVDDERHGNAERARPGRSLGHRSRSGSSVRSLPGSPTCPVRSSTRVAPITVPLDPATGIATTGPVPFTPSLAGDYYWIAEFAGDAANGAVTTRCPDPLELVRVGKATPSVTTAATVSPADPVVNQPVTTTDTATVVGAVNPDGTGTVTFWLVGPATGAPPACPSTDAAVVPPITQPIAPNGTATTGPVTFTPTQPGDYYWVTRFNGDANNNATSSRRLRRPGRTGPRQGGAEDGDRSDHASGTCLRHRGDAGHRPAARHARATDRNGHLLAGRPLCRPGHRVPAAVIGPARPHRGAGRTPPPASPRPDLSPSRRSRQVTTTGWRTTAATRTTPRSRPRAPIPSSGSRSSPPHPPSRPRPRPTVFPRSVRPSRSATPPALTELIPTQPGDTITFWLVGPISGAPPECGSVVDPVIGPLAQPIDPATATATTGPQPFTPVAAGDYYWIAQYTGDANNEGAIGVCPDVAELLTVPPATPTLATQASPASGTLGVSTQDTATVVGGFGPTGTVTFQLFGPTDPACVGTPLATFPDVSLVDGTATSPAVVTDVVGIYRWVATYNGDANNVAVTGSCDDPTEQTTVVAPAEPVQPEIVPPTTIPPSPLPPSPGPPTGLLPATGLSSTFTIWFGPFDLAVVSIMLGSLLIAGSRFARRRPTMR